MCLFLFRLALLELLVMLLLRKFKLNTYFWEEGASNLDVEGADVIGLLGLGPEGDILGRDVVVEFPVSILPGSVKQSSPLLTLFTLAMSSSQL